MTREGKIMPVKVGCASDYNKNHPESIRKKRDEETVVLIRDMVGLIAMNTLQNSLRALTRTMNGKRAK